MIFNHKYEPKKEIGRGAYGTIYKVVDNINNKFYALKFIFNQNKIEKNVFKEDYEKEAEIMKKIKNRYIIKLIDNFYDEINKGYCIVMELCDEDLRKILNRYKPNGLPLNIINIIFYQLNEALKAMREKNYTHRDLKPENILIKYSDKNKINFDIKLTDFGLSTDEINSTIHTFSQAGSPLYWAPEVGVENPRYNNQCDLWSLGVILCELYTNKYIFDDNTIEKKN